MHFEAATTRVLAMVLGEGKEYGQSDEEFKTKLSRAVEIISAAESVDHIAIYRSLDLKSFDGHYQIRIGGEKRLWFVVNGDTVLVMYIGSTDHRHGNTR